MEECTGQDWAADFWPLTTGVSTDTFSNIVGTSTTSSTLHHHNGYGQEQATFNPHYIMHHETQQQPVRAVGTGLTLGRLDLLGQKVVAASSSTSTASTVNSNTPQPSPSTGMSSETKRRGSDTARKDRSNVLKAYLMDVGCTKIRGARKRRKNDDGEYEGGKLDWDSEWVQEQLVIPLQEFASIRLDYERRSREKKLTDATIERDWVTKDGVCVPKAKMLKNYYPTNLILHRFFDLMHGRLLRSHPITPDVEDQMQSINPFVRSRPLAVILPDEDGQGGLRLFRGYVSRTDPLVVNYHHEKEHLEIDGRFSFADQSAVIAHPGLRPVDYFDDVLVKGVARRLRAGFELVTLWYSAFGKPGQADEAGPREVDVDLFLSCFSEDFRSTLRYMLLAPYEHKTTVSLEEFQAFFVWAAGLTDNPLSIQDQLAALVAGLKMKPEKVEKGFPRENICVYITTNKAKPLQKPGDFYLRTSTTQAGWIAIEYVPPFPLSRAADPVGRICMKTETGSKCSAAIKTSLFYFQASVVNGVAHVTFTDRTGTHPSIASLILKHTGSDAWGRLRQCTNFHTALSPPAGKESVPGHGPQGMVATPFGHISEPSPRMNAGGMYSSSSDTSNGIGHRANKMVVATQNIKMEGSQMITPSRGRRNKHRQQSQPYEAAPQGSSSRHQSSIDTLGMAPCLSGLDFSHSFGVGPSWRSTDHHLSPQAASEQAAGQLQALPYRQEHFQGSLPAKEQLQGHSQTYQPKPEERFQGRAQAYDVQQASVPHLLNDQCLLHPVQLEEHLPADVMSQSQPQSSPLGLEPAQVQTDCLLLGGGQGELVVPAMGAGGMEDGMALGGTLFCPPRPADRLQQQGGLDDPFVLQDFLVSSTSSFGSLGLSSFPATPAQALEGGEEGGSGGGNRFFMDQIMSGVDHLRVHQANSSSSDGSLAGAKQMTSPTSPSDLLRKRQRGE